MIRAALLLSIPAWLGACAGTGTVIVEYSLQMEVSGRDAEGRAWRAPPEDILALTPPAGSLPAFAGTRYQGGRLEWTIGASAYGFGGRVANKTDAPLCLRFDEARVSSSFSAREAPLAIAYLHRISADDPKHFRLGSNDPRKIHYFAPPQVCLAPRSSATVAMWLDLRELFPTGHMFNTRWPEGEPRLLERGIGNWLRIALPVEYGAARESMEVTLTARDSKARVSYY